MYVFTWFTDGYTINAPSWHLETDICSHSQGTFMNHALPMLVSLCNFLQLGNTKKVSAGPTARGQHRLYTVFLYHYIFTLFRLHPLTRASLLVTTDGKGQQDEWTPSWTQTWMQITVQRPWSFFISLSIGPLDNQRQLTWDTTMCSSWEGEQSFFY